MTKTKAVFFRIHVQYEHSILQIYSNGNSKTHLFVLYICMKIWWSEKCSFLVQIKPSHAEVQCFSVMY